MMLFLLTAALLLAGILTYPLLSWILSQFFSKPAPAPNTNRYYYACVIPVYNNLALAQKCIQSLLAQTYQNFTIYVVIDGDNIKREPNPSDRVIYLYPENKLGSKHRSLYYALNHFIKKPDYVFIFDADNLAEAHYIDTLNKALTPGYKSAQGRRIAKNLDSVYACLDAANEYFYNIFFREVPYRLRSSALTSGSGVAVEYDLFARFFEFHPVKKEINGVIHGEDKFLQAFIVREGSRIYYTTACTVYDEKVARGAEVSSQRARWFISYFKCFPYNVGEILNGIRHFSWRRLIFGLQASYPPIFLLLGGSGLLGLLLLFIYLPAGIIVLSGVTCLTLTFPIFLAAGGAPKKVFLSLLVAPRFIFFQFLAFFKIRKAYNKTLVTQNNRNISIEELTSP
jgi:cellulose synthase/poly-beta-1,6-N-acetylglucosamine synthase-like glycosyltransferase